MGRIGGDLNEFFRKNYIVIYHYNKHYGLGAVINDNTGILPLILYVVFHVITHIVCTE